MKKWNLWLVDKSDGGSVWSLAFKRSYPARVLVAIAVLGVVALGATSPADAATPSATDPRLSPGDDTVAFMLRTASNSELTVAPLAGGEARKLSSLGPRAQVAGWFPDSKALLVVDTGASAGVWQVDTGTGAKRKLCQGNRPRISPDGQRMLFLRERRLYLFDLGSGTETAVGLAAEPGWWRSAEWLDNTTVTALTDEGTLVTVRTDALAKTQVLVPHKSMVNSFTDIAVDAKDKRLALTSDDMQFGAPDNKSSIWIFAFDGKQAGIPIPNSLKPAWTVDGVLFLQRQDEVAMTRDFAKVVILTKADTWEVTGDGSVLVVSRCDTDTNGDGAVNWQDAHRLYRVNLRAGMVSDQKLLYPSEKGNAK